MRTAHSLGAHVAETTFYTPFANLLNTIGERLKPRVHFQAHPGTHGAGLADGGLFPLTRTTQREPLPNQRPERGAVEIKPAGYSLAILAQSAQVLRYLREYGLCLITNYHQFQLLELRNNQPRILESYNLAPTAEAFWNDPPSSLITRHAQTLADFLQRVMLRKVPLERPKDVAWLLASYARDARAESESHPPAAFASVKSALQQSLGITFEGEKGEHFFRSTLIQTLFYGIFSAWILWRRTPEAHEPNTRFRWQESADYLRIPVLRELFHAVSERGALRQSNLIPSLDHATDALNRVQPAFFASFNDEDAVNYFYEPFLQAFDPELRKQLGVWYTPREIVRYMVERVDHLLRTELNEPLGLASPNVQVLDPCCGTGAYLVEVLHRIHRTLAEQAGDDDALVGADLRRAATSRIFGFEIMPAPFVIAHLQVANLLEKAGASLAATQRAQVFLTNALTGWVPARHPQSDFGFPAFTEERDAAEAVKQADTILVILGNPPYNGYAGIALGEERELAEAYRSAVPGLPEPNGQGLNELYVRFFRIAERRITQNSGHRGIFSFISNYSWLDGLSQPTMRHHFLSSFNNIYIDNLHGDRRVSEYAPDGHTSETVFAMQGTSVGIKVGTAIATLVKTGQSNEGSSIRYRDFEDARAADRRNHLLASTEDGETYRSVEPNPVLGLPFKPRTVSTGYLDWPRLPELFEVSFPGVKTSRDALLIDIDKDKLEHRMRAYLNPEPSKTSEVQLETTSRFNAKVVRELLQMRAVRAHKGVMSSELETELRSFAFRPWQIRRYVYRPYDVRWLYWEPETKLLDEKRTEALLHTHSGNLMIEARQRESADCFCRGAIASTLADNFGAGLSSFFPIRHLVLARKRLDEGGMGDFRESYITNESVEAMNYIFQLCQVRTTDAEEHTLLFFHALATMHTPRYRAENAGALLGDWPRIPLPATSELLAHSATLGRRLVDLLDPESDLQLQAEWSFLARLQLPQEWNNNFPEENDRRNAQRFALTAGWGGPGQGATVMPRRGDARERDWTKTELTRLATLAASQSLTLDQILTLLSPRSVDVYLNGESLWAAVPLHVWDYTLGGYQVLKKWLSYRELPLLGRPLHPEEARYFTQVVRRITAILLLGPALDASYEAILPTATGFPHVN